jgi:hypothetical protein
MNCPNCKNPIEDNTNICEWCGEMVQNNAEPISNIDNEIYCLLDKNMRMEAVSRYAKTQKISWEKANKHVLMLQYLKSHKDATKETFELEYVKWKMLFNCAMILFCIGFILCMIGIGNSGMGGFTYNSDWYIYLFFGLGCIALMIILIMRARKIIKKMKL